MTLEHRQSPTPFDPPDKGDSYAMEITGSADWADQGDTSDTTHSPEPPTDSPETTPRRRASWLVELVVAPLLLAVLVLAGALFYLEHTFANRIYPNISIQGVAVGQMAESEAIQAVEAHYEDFLNQPVTLTYGQQTWTPTLYELGVQVDTEHSVQQAMETGRRQDYLANLQEVAAVWEFGREVPLAIHIDQQALQSYVLAVASEIEQPPVDAQVVFEGQDLQTTTSQPGRQVLTEETVDDLTAALQTLQSQDVPIRTRQLLPMLSDEEAAQARESLETLLQGPITLRANDEVFELSTDELADMVRVERVPSETETGNDTLVVTLDSTMIRQHLETIANETSSGFSNPRVNWNGGDLQIFEAGSPGMRVDVDRAESLVMDAAQSSQRTVDLPFAQADPPVNESNLHELGITELLGVGRSDFTGSAQYRITNIQAGMNLLHGVLVPPGEEFSFNNTIGSISAANGFVEGYAIVSNRTQLEWGGGICQDSTTMFRAAFWAGLPITERWGHSFYISWYDKYGYGDYGNGPGMDATIFTGGPDFKFLNDTGHWILVQTSVDVGSRVAEVRLYGTDPGRTVSLEGPRIFNRKPPPSQPVYVPDPRRPRGSPRHSDTARGGMDIAFTRIISQDGQTTREEFLTRFKPWPNIYEVNPADLGSDGRLATPEPEETPEGSPTPGRVVPPGALTPQPSEPGEQPPAEQPPAEQPPAEQPPVEQPPAEQPTPQPIEQPTPQSFTAPETAPTPVSMPTPEMIVVEPAPLVSGNE